MSDMIRIHIFVEGQTEETFVHTVLYEHFSNKNFHLNPILIRTSSRGRGGATNYDKIKWQIERKCKEDRGSYITTMFDLFKIPTNFPGYHSAAKISDPYKKVEHIEHEWSNELNKLDNFIPYISLHEFEALLFSELQKFEEWFGVDSANILAQELKQFDSPEHVNNGPQTAPSKRIANHCIGYDKPLHGSSIGRAIGLDTIRNKCNHFDKWIKKLESLQKI